MRQLATLVVVAVAASTALSALWSVPYVYTAVGFAAWAFFGHLITADDDLPGGWSNPDGARAFPWVALAAKGAVLCALCAIALFVPAVRHYGA